MCLMSRNRKARRWEQVERNSLSFYYSAPLASNISFIFKIFEFFNHGYFKIPFPSLRDAQ